MGDATEKKTTGTDQPDSEGTVRREFLEKIGSAGVAAPAVALLLAAKFQPAEAGVAERERLLREWLRAIQRRLDDRSASASEGRDRISSGTSPVGSVAPV